MFFLGFSSTANYFTEEFPFFLDTIHLFSKSLLCSEASICPHFLISTCFSKFHYLYDRTSSLIFLDLTEHQAIFLSIYHSTPTSCFPYPYLKADQQSLFLTQKTNKPSPDPYLTEKLTSGVSCLYLTANQQAIIPPHISKQTNKPLPDPFLTEKPTSHYPSPYLKAEPTSLFLTHISQKNQQVVLSVYISQQTNKPLSLPISHSRPTSLPS